jgi:hypothetical protein
MHRSSDSSTLSVRVRRTLEDLTVIRQSLVTTTAPGDPVASAQLLDLELAGELKSVVDALRLLLWAYIQALSVQSGRAPAEVLSWYKMQLAVEMLRSTSGRAAPTTDGPIADFERLVNQALASAAMAPEPKHTQ